MYEIQYVRKSETSFNIRLDNHRKDIKKPSTIEACKHFNNNEHTFSKHGKFIITEQLRNINTIPTEILKLRLRGRENFWIKKLKTLTPYVLKPRTELIPCYAVPVFFTLLSSFRIWTKILRYINQLTSNNLISGSKSHLQLCPLKATSAKTS